MGKTKSKVRGSPRKEVAPIAVEFLTSLEDLTKIARNLSLVEVSSSGILLHCERDSLIPQSLRKTLTLDSLIDTRVFLRIADMNLEVSGTVSRTQLSGKKGFLIAIDYSDDAPEYWRECLTDLLPRPGELD
ncbi:MAG: hypothetical protein ACLGGX_02750 [Bdellovibrionia bacterium]